MKLPGPTHGASVDVDSQGTVERPRPMDSASCMMLVGQRKQRKSSPVFSGLVSPLEMKGPDTELQKRLWLVGAQTADLRAQPQTGPPAFLCSQHLLEV